MYSGYPDAGSRPWHEELPLEEKQRKFLLELMKPDEKDGCCGTASDIKKRFLECFGEPPADTGVEKVYGREGMRPESGTVKSQP